MPVPTAQKIRFGAFELDRQTAELWKGSVKLKLQGQPIAVLALLLERPGELVTREELRKHLWPEDTFVDFEHSLNTHIKKLRQVFDDDAETPRYIETLPRRGYRFIAQVEPVPNGSAVVEQTPRAETSPESKSAPPPKPRRWKYAVLILVAFALFVGLLYRFAGPNVTQLIRLRQLQQLTVVPLTALPGSVASPTLSPDGSQIAFAWDGENNGAVYDLYVKAIGSEKPLRLTHHPATLLSAAWSPGGRSIAIFRDAGEGDTGIYLLPPTGGAERKLTSRVVTGVGGSYLSWSPDGKRIAFTDHSPNSPSDATTLLYLLTLNTLERTPVRTGCNAVQAASFSPRGDLLAWVCADTGASYSLNVQRLSDGGVTRLYQRPGGISGIAWSPDGRRIVFSAPFHSGDLLEVSLTRPGNVLRLPIGHNASDLTGSLTGGRLAYVEGITNINIWRLDLLASPPKATKLIISSREQIAPSISPDGSKITFESNRTGSSEVWVCDADGSNPIQLTSFGQKTGTPRWSPDGKLIAFDSRVAGEANIYLIDPQGGVPRKLEIDTRDNSIPSWSHDGKWIYFTKGNDVNHTSVWKVPSTGGHATQISQSPGFDPMESPDGQYVYFYRRNTLCRVRTDGSAEQVVKGMPELNPDFAGGEWYPFGSGIYFMSHWGDQAVINLFDLKTEQTRQVFQLEKPQQFWIGGMPVSSDGKWMLFPQMDEHFSNLMMIENWH